MVLHMKLNTKSNQIKLLKEKLSKFSSTNEVDVHVTKRCKMCGKFFHQDMDECPRCAE